MQKISVAGFRVQLQLYLGGTHVRLLLAGRFRVTECVEPYVKHFLENAKNSFYFMRCCWCHLQYDSFPLFLLALLI